MDMAPYQEEEKTRLRQRLSKEAVGLAIQGRWEEAETVNRDMIGRFPTDVESYNRLGRALTELGDFAQAKEAYLQALELAPGNAIAKKNLARLASLPESVATSDARPHKAPREHFRRVAPELFTAEMGKARVVNLCNMASSEVLAKMGFGIQIYLKVKGQHLVVEKEDGEYLGEVEPKQGLRLIKLIEEGNRYAAAFLAIKENKVQVLIREVYQHPSQVGHPSFPIKGAGRLRPRVRESFLRRRAVTEENEAVEEIAYPEEEREGESEEPLLEGFFVVDEDGQKEGFEP